MAKAAGQHVPAERQSPTVKDGELQELAARLENPARAQEAARSVAGDDAPNYAIEFGWLYAAVVSLNPLHAAGKIRKFAP